MNKILLFKNKLNLIKNNNLSSKIFYSKFAFSSFINPFTKEEKSKSNFLKISNNVPNEEENMAALLNEMKVAEQSKIINYIIQKNDILFISNLDENLQKIKLGSFIEINNEFNAQCLSIKENVASFLLLNRHK
jgi:hypothetical protein